MPTNRNPCGLLQPQHMQPGQLCFLASQVVPILVELICSSSCSRFRNFRELRAQRICDPRRCLVAFRLIWVTAAEVENTVLNEGERA